MSELLQCIIPRAIIARMTELLRGIIPRVIISRMTELLRGIIPRVIIPLAELFREELLYGNVLFKSHTFLVMTSVWLGTVEEVRRERKPVAGARSHMELDPHSFV